MEPVNQHFTFELYSPNSCTESAAPIMERVNVQMSGHDLGLLDVISKFEDFLRACGYASALIGQRIDLVGKDS